MQLASIGWKSPLDRRLSTRMARIQFMGMEERHTSNLKCVRVSRDSLLTAQLRQYKIAIFDTKYQ